MNSFRCRAAVIAAFTLAMAITLTPLEGAAAPGPIKWVEPGNGYGEPDGPTGCLWIGGAGLWFITLRLSPVLPAESVKSSAAERIKTTRAPHE